MTKKLLGFCWAVGSVLLLASIIWALIGVSVERSIYYRCMMVDNNEYACSSQAGWAPR